MSVTYAECHIIDLYAECRYSEYRHAECRDALTNTLAFYGSE
jgi:hypothetical protein